MSTSEEVAQLAGVSRALNGSARVSDDARKRVQSAIAALGYKPDVIAQSLVRQRSRVLAFEAAMVVLAERRDFTAIVAGSDFMAIGILRALTEQGLRVPEDISLVGFDDIDFCQYTVPLLTTVRQDRPAMGRGAVQQLVAMIEGTEGISPLILPTQLIVRKSTGMAPS